MVLFEQTIDNSLLNDALLLFNLQTSLSKYVEAAHLSRTLCRFFSGFQGSSHEVMWALNLFV